MRPESRARLDAFVERSTYIENLSYLENRENIVGFEAKQVDGQWQVEFHQPEDEKRDALLFNLRLFIQNKDDFSIARLAELYDDPGVSQEWKTEHARQRAILNERLESAAAEGASGCLSHRDVLTMFLYGKLGHYDEDDHARGLYEQWITDQTVYEILHNTFHTVVVWIVTTILNIAAISRNELARDQPEP